MTKPIQYEILEDFLVRIFQEQGENSTLSIEDFLNTELGALSSLEKTAALDRLIDRFDPGEPVKTPVDVQGNGQAKPAALAIDDHVLARVIKLLLGRDIEKADLTTEELIESLAESINTVFESLNQLISVINTTLMGKQDADETIRQVIGYHLEGSSQTRTLETYIGQIGKAFFAAQEASKKAAHAKVMQILEELSPEKIEREADVSRLSPMRKARYYEVYELKFRKFEKWFESGRFMESFLSEFEKNCQKISL